MSVVPAVAGPFCYDYFLENIDSETRSDTYTKEAVRMPLVNLIAVAATCRQYTGGTESWLAGKYYCMKR